MLPALTQKYRQARIKTALPDDHLLFHAMRMTEGLSTLYEMQLELFSEDPNLDFSGVLGHNTTVGLDRTIGGERYFNGYITSFGFGGMRGRKYLYRATAAPWLWFLTQTRNSRIFNNESPIDIISTIFGDHGFSAFKFDVKRSVDTYEYCVQYDESDFAFVSRLLEKEGLYYFFRHENGSHEMVIVDQIGAQPSEPGYESIDFVLHENDPTLQREGIRQWRQNQHVRSTKYVMQDFDFKQPRADLTAQHSVARDHDASNLEIYHYPGEYTDTGVGGEYARLRAEERQAGFEVVQGETNARGIRAGYVFDLAKHPLAHMNGGFMTISAHHEVRIDEYDTRETEVGDEGPTYSCVFTAMPVEGVYRAPMRTPKPRITGPQTAIVVNDTKGEEIEPDEFGRVKVSFHWEREGKSSCWIRVSQAWAGAGWGAMSIPRDGQEVIVEHIEGDPNRPIITGRVYNAKSEYPYDPPAKPTVTTFKTNSSKGGGGFNELRFDDKKGEENIFVHAEKTMDVRTKSSKRQTIGYEHHEIVAESEYRKVGKDVNELVEGNVRLEAAEIISTVSSMGAIYTKASGGDIAVDAAMNYHAKAGMNAVIEAGAGLTIKCGASFITLNTSGVYIKGPMVHINSAGSALSGCGEQAEPPEEAAYAKNDQAGEISERTRGRSHTPDKTELDSHRVAAALLAAADSGAPFCAICASMAGGGGGEGGGTSGGPSGGPDGGMGG